MPEYGPSVWFQGNTNIPSQTSLSVKSVKTYCIIETPYIKTPKNSPGQSQLDKLSLRIGLSHLLIRNSVVKSQKLYEIKDFSRKSFVTIAYDFCDRQFGLRIMPAQSVLSNLQSYISDRIFSSSQLKTNLDGPKKKKLLHK